MAAPMAYPVAQSDPTSVVGRRVLACVLDGLIVIIPAILLVTANFQYIDVDDLDGRTGEEYCDEYLDELGGMCVDFEDVDDRVYISDDFGNGSTAYYWLANLLLLVVLQAFTGWTPGKLVAGIRVIREDGRPPGLVKAFVRWVLWIVDGFPYFIPGLTGFIVALSTPGHRRVGDMAATTFVVRRNAAGTPLSIGSGGQLVIGGAAAAPSPSWGTPPPADLGVPVGSASPTDPTAAGWASPAAETPVSPSPPAAAPPPGTDAPQWDPARGTYIQWDPVQRAWMQWDEGFKAWTRIPGQ